MILSVYSSINDTAFSRHPYPACWFLFLPSHEDHNISSTYQHSLFFCGHDLLYLEMVPTESGGELRVQDGVQRTQYPAIFILLALILEETNGSFPYTSLLVTCSCHFIFKAFRSIRVYVPSSEFCCLTFKVHDSDPYSNTLSTVATNSRLLSGRFVLDFHRVCMLCSAFQAKAFLTLISFSDEFIHDLRYLKSFSTSNICPSAVFNIIWYTLPNAIVNML